MGRFLSSQYPKSFNRIVRPWPCNLAYFWICVSPLAGYSPGAEQRDAQLVLNAHSIPFKTISLNHAEHFYVPPVLAKLAKKHLNNYFLENRPRHKKLVRWPIHPHSYLIILLLCPIILWFGWTKGVWPIPDVVYSYGVPVPQNWQGLGSLNAAAVHFSHQWERIFTSLTLHADVRHLSGNMFFGAIFLIVLARMTGWGAAFLLTILAGGLANILNIFFQPLSYRSMGFSTALFACAGIMGGIESRRVESRKKMLLPIAAVVALLALLGTEGENTDYSAHICGIISGLIIGFLGGFKLGKFESFIGQTAFAITGLLILACAWVMAFWHT